VPAALWYSKISVGELEQELEEQWGENKKVTWTRYATWQPRWQSNNGGILPSGTLSRHRNGDICVQTIPTGIIWAIRI
jgi:hypothetical protein